jgi:hypothetical protein
MARLAEGTEFTTRGRRQLLVSSWARGEFSVHESRLKGSDPALDAILPLASVACGLIALGTVFSLIAATS